MADEKKQQQMPVRPDISKGQKAIAEWYFLVHQNDLALVGVDSILVSDDGEVFYNTPKGVNAATNYCAINKLSVNGKDGYKKFENPL